MKKILTSIVAGLFVFLITRALAYLLGLDAVALRVAQRFLELPALDLQLIGWLLSGFVGLVVLVLWLVLDLGDWLRQALAPRPPIGSLPVAGDPTLKFEVNRTTGKVSAELFVDLVNNSDDLVFAEFALRATVNGKDLDAPILGQGHAAPGEKMRLFVRFDEVPMREDLLAVMEYDLKYLFKVRGRRQRRTAKGIEWRTQKPEGRPGPAGGKVVKMITVKYYNQIEE
ncbi:hypothetical protein XH81_04285 [Bradyrhizobium sp. CCBAU 25360]|uniref:hypothetical protein n=1 Tax=Bradyrhizobium sp. CCBAU 25360 TaxID=858425 RepID=UPI002306709E|nr:hypothetical protein [Bradyrhizobium sp. CCBAU 25360]MDA9414083.1 hypothetical protein [Bradyrhizobium sp. CCBAU 25360]